jgi:E3 ubiquitin-protein ligase listerin
VSPFLNFAFDLLGHSTGKPEAISKIDVTALPDDSGASPRQELDHLLSHIYYLSLIYVSSLTKSWWFSCSSRLTVQTVETWTAKYICPPILSATLNLVQEWAKTTANTEPEEGNPLTIKINSQTHEIVVVYPINAPDEDALDNHTLSILITLPQTFPLHQATVTSLTAKPTFDERRWQSWLRSAQGVIAFSNNNVVDGLLAWRRNIVGALQGKSECTICYSLVGEDGKLPSRKCKTCRNSFHLVCLSKWFSSSRSTTCPLCRSEFTNAVKRRGARHEEE